MSASITDDLLPPSVAEDIRQLLMGEDFPWFFQKNIVFEGDLNSHYFTHIMYFQYKINSDFYGAVEPIIDAIKPRALYRVKVNLYPPSSTIFEHGLHVDVNWDDIHTAVYYVNSNDGYTALEDGTRIESVQNRLAVIPPLTRHTSSTSTKTRRITINFNWF